jgi:hypothetical protein
VLCLSGCGPLRPLLAVRGNPYSPDGPDAARAELVDRYNGLADHLSATAAFYDREAEKAHVKMRVMSVLVGVGATGSGASIAALARPEFPDEGRPGLASLGISMAVFSGLMAILPHAHQYILKEAGYRQQARLTRDDLAHADAICGLSMLDPDRPLDELTACVAGLSGSLARARVFDEDSPCRPPPEAELARALERARR